ncbi:RNA polymerase I-specific transcription initiation factor RRN3 [Pisolithus croceorrhizus]|nr:RNA polymerase I-specific transcription initiation factor RRN3 [Pisolithus croceorrhizus]KAI6166363.1 RNA polymerase I-specific transcription initiation factor RRN3 [Pisolithus thermaeus]
MDPHSTHSQFNQRAPKSGPYMPSMRYMDSNPKISLENYAKRPSSKSPRPDSRAVDTISLLTQRPIATNSRVKQDEQFKKDMYIAFINKALQGKLDGQCKDFDDLVDQFNPRKAIQSATSSSQLRLWILALSHVLSRLERRHSPLVEAIVNLPWTTMDATFVKTYTDFIGMLLSARPEYLSLVLGKLTQGLTYQSGLQALNANGPEGSETPLTRRIIYDRLHYLLGHLLSLIPTLPQTLQPLLSRNFPHKRQPQAAQVTYIRNLLRVTEYCSELSDRILALIIDRALQIDVEIQVELEELEEEGGLGNADVFEFDPFDTVVGQEGDEDSDEDSDEASDTASDFSSDDSSDGGEDDPDLPANAQHIQDMVNKLDSILKVVFDHFNRLHSATEVTVSQRSDSLLSPPTSPRPSSPVSAETGRAVRDAQFHTLLAIFDRTIIRTFKSRYTQFLIFWYSSLDVEFSDLFQGLLVEKALLGQNVPAVTRAAAASYIASFVSRAQFVDRDATRRVVAVLCAYLKSHLDSFDSVIQAGEEPPSMAHHSLFYAIVQAVFLIFCFRWRDLEEEFDESEEYQTGKKWMNELNVIQRVITSPLNPLKICSPNVVMQFSRVAQATDFAYCYSILEANKRSEYNLSAGSIPILPQLANEGFSQTELHTFFPFDPYKLPRSSSYIQGVYRDWASVAIDEEEEEEEDGEEDDGFSDNHASAASGIVLSSAILDVGPMPTGRLGIPGHSRSSSDADGLGESLGGMSISPQPQSIVMAS